MCPLNKQEFDPDVIVFDSATAVGALLADLLNTTKVGVAVLPALAPIMLMPSGTPSISSKIAPFPYWQPQPAVSTF